MLSYVSPKVEEFRWWLGEPVSGGLLARGLGQTVNDMVQLRIELLERSAMRQHGVYSAELSRPVRIVANIQAGICGIVPAVLTP